MRWTLRIAALLAVLLLAYAIWPVTGFFRIAPAVEPREAAALGKLVDFHSLRKSLTKQLVAAYIEITGQLGLLRKTPSVPPMPSRSSPADQLQTFIDLLSKGEGGGAKIPADLAPFSKSRCRAAGRPGGPPNTASAIITSICGPISPRPAVQGEAQPA